MKLVRVVYVRIQVYKFSWPYAFVMQAYVQCFYTMLLEFISRAMRPLYTVSVHTSTFFSDDFCSEKSLGE